MATAASPANNNKAAFDAYYHEFSSLLQKLENPNETKAKRDEELLKQCSDLLKLLALEARNTECPDKELERLERVKIYKFQLEAVRNKNDKDFLVGDRAASMLLKERLDRVESRAAQQNELLERAQRSLAQTEEVAVGISSELHNNRATIESAQGRVGELNSITERASRLVKNLSKPWYLRWTNRR